MALPAPKHDDFNGKDAAALLAAGIGIFALGLGNTLGAWLVTTHRLSCSITRPLLTAVAFAVWLGAWGVLRRAWRNATKPAKDLTLWAATLIVLGLLLGSPLLTWFWPGVHLP